MIYFKYPLLLLLILLQIIFIINADEDLYKLLGVSKTATTREIRQAFKKLALIKHPDKNQDDPTANENFIKINRAYEVLKDDDLRKKYDQFGEKGLHDDNRGYNNYQSWNFYHQNFGIYDDDPEIITLSRSDFMQSVDGSSDIWFINFYSTQCSHCHELAPVWRQLAKELDGVIRIGAVNCMDDWQLCNEQQIPMFPQLIMYPKKEHYTRERTLDSLLKYALSFANGAYYTLQTNTFNKIINANANKLWFISFCMPDLDEDDQGDANCLDESILQKLSIMLNGLINVGLINCNYDKSLCDTLKPTSANLFFKNIKILNEPQDDMIEIKEITQKDIAGALLKYLPDLTLLNKELFEEALKALKEKKAKPWLIQFVQNFDSNTDLELRKLPFLLNEVNVGRVDCQNMMDYCAKYLITKYPTFVLLKRRNLFEHHYGRLNAHDLASFARENAFTNVKTLSALDFPAFIETDKPAFIDFFAPWCPPCMHLLPQFRKAAKTSGRKVNFGTVDCTVHTTVCQQYNVHSYPTTILFNQTVPHPFHGQHSETDLNDFIQDIMNPIVYTLNYKSFNELVGKKPVGKIWLVDFYASWCGPCQQMAPEWRKLAKKLEGVAFVGQVDCVIETALCAENSVSAYPHIRLYASNIVGSSRYQIYNNNFWRDVNSLYQWASNYLPSKSTILNNANFEKLVINSKKPWLIDFYAPWCGHCQVFAPVFETIAGKLEGKVQCGKVNCQEENYLCTRVGLRHYPTVKFYKSNSKSWSGEDVHNIDSNFIMDYIKQQLNIKRDEL